MSKRTGGKISFICLNCGKFVSTGKSIGTAHRNHCPYCLWSRHVDEFAEGDRKASCQAGMEPIGLTFKKTKPDKYRPEEKGELMIVHRCQNCQKISINRIAADDEPKALLGLLEKAETQDEETRTELVNEGIKWLTQEDLPEVRKQLYGVLGGKLN